MSNNLFRACTVQVHLVTKTLSRSGFCFSTTQPNWKSKGYEKIVYSFVRQMLFRLKIKSEDKKDKNEHSEYRIFGFY